MADNAQKTPLVETLNRFVDRKGALAEQMLGKAIPASVISLDPTNTIATVRFEIQSDVLTTLPEVTCPVFGPQYVRYPLKAGDKGYVLPSDYYMGGVSGLGGGTAVFERQGNLSNLVFFPVGNKEFEPTDDAEAYVAYGPNGVVLRTEDGTVKLILDRDGVRVEIDGQIRSIITR